MPAPVSYWTGVWEPAFEAHSQEVEALRRALAPGAAVVSAASRQRTRLVPRRGVWRLNSRRALLLRGLGAWLEPRAAVSHLFGGMGNWHFLRALGRRPLLFTVTLAGRPADLALYRKVSLFAAETEDLAERLAGAGVAPERIRVIAPGVDLERFAPAPADPQPRPFRLLFASAPALPDELAERGVPLLVELARRAPGVEVVLLWRPWGDIAAARRALAALEPPANLRLEFGARDDMPAVYRSCDAVVHCPRPDFGKSAPNAVIEGLACGRPALVTSACGLAAPIAAAGAGVVAEASAAGLAAGIERLRCGYASFAAAARALAVLRFDRAAFVAAYARIYRELTTAGVGVRAER